MYRPLLILVLFLSAWFLQNCGDADPDPREDALDRLRAIWLADVAALDESLSVLAMALRAEAPDSICRTAFQRARSRYKAREFLWEYAFPATARKLNGSPAEVGRGDVVAVIPVEGLQALETLLYPSLSGESDRRVEIVEAMRRALAEVPAAADFEPIGPRLIPRPFAFTDSSLLEAVRLEIIRLGSLGLTGFDSPLALQSLPETREALLGMESWLAVAFPDSVGEAAAAFDSLRLALRSAAAASAGDFASFDRLAFLTRHLDPASAALSRFQREAGIPLPREPRGFDPFLSGEDTRTCASCPLPGSAFTDGLDRSPALPGLKSIARNSSPPLHEAFQRGSFRDSRAESL